jgi:hypothetical protein
VATNRPHEVGDGRDQRALWLHWDEISDITFEALNMQMRSDLMAALEKVIKTKS